MVLPAAEVVVVVEVVKFEIFVVVPDTMKGRSAVDLWVARAGACCPADLVHLPWLSERRGGCWNE